MQWNNRYHDETFTGFITKNFTNKKIKSFIKPSLYYAGIIYDEPFNKSFKTKIEMIQYRAPFVITGVTNGT